MERNGPPMRTYTVSQGYSASLQQGYGSGLPNREPIAGPRVTLKEINLFQQIIAMSRGHVRGGALSQGPVFNAFHRIHTKS